jgi:hypothetical protein
VSLLTDGLLARLFWRIVDGLDYWLTQAVLWSVEAVCRPEPETTEGWRRSRGCDPTAPTDGDVLCR